MAFKLVAVSALVLFGLASLPTDACAEITAHKTEDGVAIRIDGKLFTQYLTQAGHAPAMWPVIGPTGEAVTRGFPFEPATKDGTKDHPHHQSLWLAIDKVNGGDFWEANKKDDKGDTGPHIAHREFVKVESNGSIARVVTRNDWMNGEKRICEDERTVTYGFGDDNSRWIDFKITIKASDGDVTFGDTKEGMFALRVADSMRVDAKQGGRIFNSSGKENQDAWGLPARWVDYTGPVGGETVGITVMSHPKSFRPLPRWHVRTYGLFAANPIGQSDFPNPEAAKQGPVTLKNGESMTLRYRVLLHRGPTDRVATEKAFRAFATR
jgi:hypothetical protein